MPFTLRTPWSISVCSLLISLSCDLCASRKSISHGKVKEPDKSFFNFAKTQAKANFCYHVAQSAHLTISNSGWGDESGLTWHAKKLAHPVPDSYQFLRRQHNDCIDDWWTFYWNDSLVANKTHACPPRSMITPFADSSSLNCMIQMPLVCWCGLLSPSSFCNSQQKLHRNFSLANFFARPRGTMKTKYDGAVLHCS